MKTIARIIIVGLLAVTARAALLNNSVAQGSTTSGQYGQLAQGAATTSAPTYITGQTAPFSLTLNGALRVDGSGVTQPVSGTFWQGTQPVSGTFWQATQPVNGTFWQTTQPISVASLPLPSGASTSAKQPALGTAGAASADVITIQGVASMTAIKVDGSAVTQPVSGSVTANAGTNLNTSSLALDATLTNGTQQTKITDGANVATVKAASTAAGATDKALVVAISPNNTVPVSLSGNQAVNMAQVAGTTTDTNSGNKSAGTLRVVIATDQPQNANALKVDASATTQPVSASSLPLPSGAATETTLAKLAQAQGSTTSGQSGTLMQGAVTTSSPTYTTAQTSPLSLDATGALRVNITAGAAAGGTSSNFGSAFPAAGTAIGVKDSGGTNLTNLKANASNALVVDGSAVTQPVSISGNQAVNLAQVAGTSASVNVGALDAGTQRVAMASMQITGQATQTASGNDILLASAGAGSIDTLGYVMFSIQIIPTGTVSSGVVTFEGSNDNTTFVATPLYDEATPTALPTTTVSPATGVNRFVKGFTVWRYIRARISTVIGGGGSLQAITTFGQTPFIPAHVPLVGEGVPASAVPGTSLMVAGGSVAGATNLTSLTVKAASIAPAATDTAAVVDIRPGSMFPVAATQNDATSNVAMTQIAADEQKYNGSQWERSYNNWNTTLTDSGAKTVTFNGGGQQNMGARGAYIWVNVGAVSGTSPTMVCQLQVSYDAGTTYMNLGPAATALTTTSTSDLFIVYPTNISQAAGATPANLTTGATNTIAINAPLPRTFRMVYTIGGTTPSFTITNVQVSFIN